MIPSVAARGLLLVYKLLMMLPSRRSLKSFFVGVIVVVIVFVLSYRYPHRLPTGLIVGRGEDTPMLTCIEKRW